ADDTELTPRPRQVLCDGFLAAVERHLDGTGPDPVQAIAALRALRRRELLRLACADVLQQARSLAPAHPVDTTAVGTALSELADATLAAALRVAHAAAPPPPGLRFAVIGLGRLGGYEMSYPSDADVLFVYDPPPGLPDEEAQAAAHALAEELRRLLAMPAPDPPL